jgi:hypothetical protein
MRDTDLFGGGSSEKYAHYLVVCRRSACVCIADLFEGKHKNIFCCACASLTCLKEEAVDNMRGIVDAEADSDDQIDTGNDVKNIYCCACALLTCLE